MTSGARTKLAVLGSPIAHSLSPALHRAAYQTLSLPWSYQSIELTGDGLADFLDTRTEEWRGLSLTMPLKRDVIPLLDSVDELAELTGAANTVLFDSAGNVESTRRGFNTDVYGITHSFAQHGVTKLTDVVVLGGGATAMSALAAVARLGAQRVDFWVRSPLKAFSLIALGARIGVAVSTRSLIDAVESPHQPDAVISTLPNGSVVDFVFSETLRKTAPLFDVAYDPWPTPLAASWLEVGGTVIPGIDMLVNQALIQVRIFVAGSPTIQLPGEERVLAAMRSSLA